MSAISSLFSVLNLDAEDDKEQIACLATIASSDENSMRKSGDGHKKSRENSKQRSGVGHKKNGEIAVKRDSSKSYKFDNKLLPPQPPSPPPPSSSLASSSLSSSGSYNLPLVWIDLEMTGLVVEVDRILEIACVITDGKLAKYVEGPDLVINQSKQCLDNMGDWCRKHHAASGLTERVLESTITEKDAEEQVINFVKNHVGSKVPLLAGNSIYMDFMFLKKYMPCLADIFSHVLVDVSSISALCMRWFPKEKRAAPAKEKKHRAMDDIKESIRELKYYRENIFKGQHRSK